MPRIARIAEPDYPHHIVQRGNNKQAVFFDDHDRKFYLGLVHKYVAECDCRINAYCLMPNHIHMLLVPLGCGALSKAMQKISLKYTQYINMKYNRTGRLWECRFYSSLIEKDAHLWSVCRYIERNPVRANIVDVPEAYRWSSAGVRHLARKEDNFVEPIWNDDYEKEEYLRFLNLPEKADEITAIRNATHRCIPIGSRIFIEMISKKLDIAIIKGPRGRPRNETSH